MKMLVKFSKLGGAVFMSHLDLLRCVQRTMRRAELPVKYSHGFNPHQVLSFAQALSLGMESDGEYFQTELSGFISAEVFIELFNGSAPEGVRALAAREMNEKRNAMAAVAAADYIIMPKGEYSGWQQAIDEFLEMQVYMYTKTGKSGSRQLDMRKRVFSAEYGDDIISCRLACGDDNLQAGVFYNALCEIAGIEYGSEIKRRDLLRRNHAGKLVSLIEND